MKGSTSTDRSRARAAVGRTTPVGVIVRIPVLDGSRIFSVLVTFVIPVTLFSLCAPVRLIAIRTVDRTRRRTRQKVAQLVDVRRLDKMMIETCRA